jgi:uncharacterized membrane protein
MNPTAVPAGTVVQPKPRSLAWLGWTLVLGLNAYFVVRSLPRYFIFTPESYGAYYWSKVSWLVPHIAAGLVAVLIGPLQFWPRLRRDYLHTHRITGRFYVGAVLIGSLSSFGLAVTAISRNPAFAVGLIGLGLAWLSTTLMAFVAIRRRNIPQHRQWMVRSYVVTFAFVTFRLAEDAMTAAQLLNTRDRIALLAWACWAIPLLFTEIVLQAGPVLKTRTA